MAEQLLLCANEQTVTPGAARGLGERGWLVVRATSIRETRRAASTGGFETVVLDLALANAEDADVLHDILRNSPDADLLLLVPYSHVEVAVTAMRLGAADYLTKPLHPEELALRLERLREVRSERQELRRLRAMVDEGLGASDASPPFTLHLDDQDRPIRFAELVRSFEREVVAWALEKAEGVEARAAAILGIPAAHLRALRASAG